MTITKNIDEIVKEARKLINEINELSNIANQRRLALIAGFKEAIE